jgi:hypothetical protein
MREQGIAWRDWATHDGATGQPYCTIMFLFGLFDVPETSVNRCRATAARAGTRLALTSSPFIAEVAPCPPAKCST